MTMAETNQRRRNGALWLGLLLALLGFLSNGLTFLGFPAAAVPWISLVLPVMGAGLVFLGLWRAFRRSGIYRGKIAGSILAVLSVLLLGLSIAFFWGARHIPPLAAGTPTIGQRAPDFTLPDSSGNPVSLTQLFDSSSPNPAPKAVLLVFYRGYW
jgi:hypothetical protein